MLPDILVVDHDRESLKFLCNRLVGEGYKVYRAMNAMGAMGVLFSKGCPIIITEKRLPEIDGGKLCSMIREHEGISTAYIIMMGDECENIILEAFGDGIDDYIPKPIEITGLLARLLSASRNVKLQQDLNRRNLESIRFGAQMEVLQDKQEDLNRRLLEMATTDELTGLANRRAILELLGRCWASSERDISPLSCVMVDIDYFKRINDKYGHGVGDAILRSTAITIRSCMREEEQAGRVGGEEFLIVLPRTTESRAAEVAERLRIAVGRSNIITEAGPMGVEISLGVAQKSSDIQSVEELMASADEALYSAKTSGRNQTCLATMVREEKCNRLLTSSSDHKGQAKPHGRSET